MATEPSAPSSNAADKPVISGKYKWYALGILNVCYVFSYLDRQIFYILQEAIKTDLNLSDTQLGFLGGLAFAVLYATFGIPMARMADKHSRAKMIAIFVAVWSVMTSLCGATKGFYTMALARIGVGVGEAGCNPAAHSMISDYFPPQQRATALSIYQLGAQIGVALGFLIGGFVNVYLGWRAAFLMVGGPGLILAVIVWFTLKEPVRGQSEGQGSAVQNAERPSLKDSILFLWNNKTYRYIALAFAMLGFVSYGAGQWTPSYFIRTFGVDTGTLALYLAAISAFAGGASTLAGGFIGDRLAKYDVRWLCWISALSMFVSKILFVVMLFQPTFIGAMIWFIFPALLNGLAIGPSFAIAQSLVPFRMRALAASLIIFMNNMIGLGFGPLAVGMLSDYLIESGVENSLRWSLLINTLFAALAVFFFYMASRTIKKDLDAAR